MGFGGISLKRLGMLSSVCYYKCLLGRAKEMKGCVQQEVVNDGLVLNEIQHMSLLLDVTGAEVKDA